MILIMITFTKAQLTQVHAQWWKYFSFKTIKSNEGILITGLPNDTDYSDNALIEMVKNFQNCARLEWLALR